MPCNISTDSKTLTWPPPLKIEGNITFHTNELDNLVEGEEVNSNYQEDDYDYQEDEYDNLTEEEDENEYLQENDEGEQFQHPFVSDEDPKDTSVVIPIVLVLVVVVSLISAVMYTLKHKKKVVFPKSLTHFIENKRPCYVLNLKTEESTKCIVEQLEEVKNDPEINQKYKGQEEVVNSLDNGDNDTINTDGGSNELVDTEWTDPYAAKIEINGTDQKTVSTENVEIDINDLDSNHDICQTHFESMKQNCTADHWGYDKPQIPLNMC
ncbi:uncharacterized protein [Narcine bancroftii]|uniref:uncharacterized protein n=1 Tax=Narcine bancroftii TaxID=1343680 RepID=UPI003831629B